MPAILFLALALFTLSGTAFAQMSTSFPAEKIDTAIINRRGLQEKIRMLTEECNWSDRVGGMIDVFYLRTERGSFFGYSYEYFLDCDNVRLIYWYDNPGGVGTPVDFMIEDLEDESMWVVAKKRHLKNKKKYQHLLAAGADGE
ncbi:hypothetical protein [Neolewinella xylanilytica]|nr:hypothetical protein [Neolewinella xylanilytica]